MGNPTTSFKFHLEFSNVDEEKKIDPMNHFIMIEPIGDDFVVNCDKANVTKIFFISSIFGVCVCVCGGVFFEIFLTIFKKCYCEKISTISIY